MLYSKLLLGLRINVAGVPWPMWRLEVLQCGQNLNSLCIVNKAHPEICRINWTLNSLKRVTVMLQD